MTDDIKYIKFGNEQRLLVRDTNGDYKDKYGTIYPSVLWDKGYCGLAPIETGKWDPFWINGCTNHDRSFSALKAGYENPNDSNLKVAGRFTESVLSTMAQGAYALALGIPYIVVGAGLGMLRWWQLEKSND